MTIPLEDLDQAVAAMLQLGMGRPGGLPEGPTSNTGQSVLDLMPYWYLEPQDGAYFAANLAAQWDAWVDRDFDIITVGRNKASANGLLDKARAAWVDPVAWPITLVGYSVFGREPTDGPRKPVKEAVNFWSVGETFRLSVSRSS